MAFQPEHIGLYFGKAQIEQVQQQRDADEVLQMAWQWLIAKPDAVIREIKPDKRDAEPMIIRKPVLQGIHAAVAAGFAYRFAGDNQAGKDAAQFLQSTLQDKSTLLETVMETIAAAHVYEMVRPLAGDVWRNPFAAYVDALAATDDIPYVERTWLLTLALVAAVVLDDEKRFSRAVEQFKHIIDNDIHPEGYIKPVLSDAPEASATYSDMFLTLAALALAAEAATQAGVDLWTYEKREVGLNTVATYLVYYYFYPEKWHWKIAPTEAEVRQLFQQYGAFMEFATYRGQPRGVEMLLEEQRPLFSGLAGGLTTLSHRKIQPRKKRWFGR